MRSFKFLKEMGLDFFRNVRLLVIGMDMMKLSMVYDFYFKLKWRTFCLFFFGIAVYESLIYRKLELFSTKRCRSKWLL